MAFFTIDELIAPLSTAQVKAGIYQALGILGVNTSSWKPGAVVRTQIAASSMIMAALSQLQADMARSAFLESATGSWLTLVARYVYGVERLEATFASGTETLTNTGGGVFALGPDDLVFVRPATGGRPEKTYRNSGSVTLGALTTITIPIVATEPGSASSAAIGEIWQLSTTLLGVNVSNPVALVGLDAETDSALRERCYEQLGALSPMGPWDAYGSALRNAKRSDGSTLGITRTRLNADGKGNIDVYCATAGGAVPGTVGDLTSDLGIADAAVQASATPAGVTAIVQSASAVPIAVTYELWMYNSSGRTQAEVEQLVSDRLSLAPDGFFPKQPIGGTRTGGSAGKAYVDAIRSAIGNAVSDTFHVVVTLPAADVVLAISEVPTAGVITAIAIHFETAPGALH